MTSAQPRSKHASTNPRPRTAPYGAGTVFEVAVKRGDKVYSAFRARRSVKIGAQKHLVQAQRKTASEAVRALEDAILKKRVALGELGVEHLPREEQFEIVTVQKVLHDWLTAKRDDLSSASYKMYDARIRRHLLPAFGDAPVRTITHEQLKQFFKETLPNKPLGQSSIKQIFVALKSALDHAQRDGIITAHPMVGLKQPHARVRTNEEKTEIRRAGKFVNKYLLDEARRTGNEARWLLAMVGLRQSEALGMTDECLVTKGSGESKTRRVLIKHQIERVRGEHGCGPWSVKAESWPCGRKQRGCTSPTREASWQLRSTKTSSGEREIVVPERVWQVLIAHRNAQRARRKQSGWKPAQGNGLDQLLFTTERGTPIHGQQDRRALYAMLDNFKAKGSLTVHTLRHIATTMLLDGKADREHVISVMGWSAKNADQQIATYSHVDTAKKAAADVSDYFDSFYPDPEKMQRSLTV